MPVPTTTDQFQALLLRSGLVERETFDRFLEQTPGMDDPKELADRMVIGGLLTSFQADNLLKGKARGFTIGKYRVLDRLGIGGTGLVYLCEHAVVRRPVAIKVLPPKVSSNPAMLERLYREARAAGSLDHPNLVKAHDIDQDGGLHFLVMEYVEGRSLHDLVARDGPLPIDRAAEYVRQAAAGLQHAHDSGLIHRDVKPGNILLDREGVIRILDLGLARYYTDESDPLTGKYNMKNILGTIDYISPEQAQNSHNVDVRADIYSLGATFYFLLTGQTPFTGGTANQILIWHQTREPIRVDVIRPEVPAGLADVVKKMLAKNPDHRHQTMAGVIDALAQWTSPGVVPSSGEQPGPVPSPTRSRVNITLPRVAPQTSTSDSSMKTTQRVPLDASPTQTVARVGCESLPDTPPVAAIPAKRPPSPTSRTQIPRVPPPRRETSTVSPWTWVILGLAAAAGIAVRLVPLLFAR